MIGVCYITFDKILLIVSQLLIIPTKSGIGMVGILFKTMLEYAVLIYDQCFSLKINKHFQTIHIIKHIFVKTKTDTDMPSLQTFSCFIENYSELSR